MHLWLRGNASNLRHVINGPITIDSCPENCKVYQEEVAKREYYDCRWQVNEEEYSVCGMCTEKLGCRAISKVCFCTRCKKEKEGHSSYQDWRESRDLGCDD